MKKTKITKSAHKLKWIETSPKKYVKGKYYGDETILVGDIKCKFLKLNPGVHTTRHNHKNQNMEEWHYIISGSGHAFSYNKAEKVIEKTKLTAGQFAPKRDSSSPDHEIINDGKEPLIIMGIERDIR